MSLQSLPQDRLRQTIQETLPGIDAVNSVDVSSLSLGLHMGTVFVHEDVYQLITGTTCPPAHLDLHQRAALLALLADARVVQREDSVGYLKHWLVGAHSSSNAPMLYRFAIFESSRVDGWLITESLL